MQSSKLRRAIAHEAALLLYRHEETEFYQAKNKASRRLSPLRGVDAVQ